MRKEYLSRLIELLNQTKTDAVFIAPSEEMKFLIGHSPYLCERFQGLFVTEKGEYFYICNLLTVDEMKEILGEKSKIYGWFDGDIFTDTVEKALKDHDLLGKTIGVNSTARAFNIRQIENKMDVEFVNGKPLLDEMRIIKSEEELENLRKASELTDEVLKELIPYIKPGIKEADIQNKIMELFSNKGVEGGGLVASGPNSALPHYFGNQRVIQEKDIIIIDFGCSYNNMNSDMTRTVFVGGITEEEREVYNLVLEANIAGEAEAQEGAVSKDVDKAARWVIEEQGYGKYFTTRLGHGIGYSVHEAPDIKGSSDRVLEKGMAFSIEPGIYMNGKFGVRIEDIVIISQKGTEVINKFPKEIILL